MPATRAIRVDVTVLGTASLLALALGGAAALPARQFRTAPAERVVAQGGAAGYAGVWMSADDSVRLDLAADLTYERSIVGRRATAVGTYTIEPSGLVLRDSSGLRTRVAAAADGRLEMAGYLLTRL